MSPRSSVKIFSLLFFLFYLESCATTTSWTEESIIEGKHALKYEYTGGLSDPSSKQVVVDQKGRAIIRVSSHKTKFEVHCIELSKEDRTGLWNLVDELTDEDFGRTYQVANDAAVHTLIFYEKGIEINRIRYSTLPSERIKMIKTKLNEIIQDL